MRRKRSMQFWRAIEGQHNSWAALRWPRGLLSMRDRNPPSLRVSMIDETNGFPWSIPWSIPRSLIDRRRLLIGAGIAGLIASRAAAQSSQRSRLVGAIEEDPPVINPAITQAISSFATGSPVYNPLLYTTQDNQVVMALAESYEVSDDGKVYTFHLRKGVVWHDGHPFTSADVKFSIENVNAKIHPSGRGAYKSLERVETPDEHTVRYVLRNPSAALIAGVEMSCGAILPKHLWEGASVVGNPLSFKPVGTGPYKLVEYVRGDFLRYEKNEKFFIPGKPDFDEIVLRIMPDAAARVAAFEKGELDMLYHSALPMVDAPRLAKLPNVKLKQTDLRGAAYLGIINMRRKPYDDVRVRQALAHAIDRQYLRDNVNAGYTIKMIAHVPPASPMHNASLKDYEFSPEKANALLDQAGYPRKDDGTRFTFDLLWPVYDTGVAKMGAVIQQNLQAVGITANLQPLDRSALNQRGYVALQFDMIIESYGQGPDPDLGVERLYNSTNIQNPPAPFTNSSGYRNPEVDKLFDEQRPLIDVARRKAIYDRIQEILWRDMPILPIYSYAPPNVYRSSSVDGLYDWAYGNHENYMNAVRVQKADVAAPSSRRWIGWSVGAAVVAAIGLFAARILRRRDREA